MDNLKGIFDLIVDMAPFVMYGAVLIKLYRSWKLIKDTADQVRRHALSAVMLMMVLVIGVALLSNVYALVMNGKTYMSLRMFQLFLAANCVVYWMLIDIMTKTAAPDEGRLREPAQ